MANPIPTLMCVKYRGAGNVTVRKLLNGITLDPTQDGNDVLVTSSEAPVGSTDHQHFNRLVEAFGKRYLLHGHRVYERDEGGDGNWGVVSEPDLGGQSVTDKAHSGLHLLYPAGGPTLAFRYHIDATPLQIAKTTDGSTWTVQGSGLAAVNADNNVGPSIVYGDSIFWWLEGNSGTVEVRAFNFDTLVATQYSIVGAGESNFHVHDDKLYILVPDSGLFAQLFRFDGSGFTDLG